MNKTIKLILCIAAAFAVAAAAVYAVVRYKEQILDFFGKLKEGCGVSKKFTNEEYEDFADI